jgi:hypothetical protein
VQSDLRLSRARLCFFGPDKGFQLIEFSNLRRGLGSVGFGQSFANLFNPGDDGGVMHSGHSLDGPETRSIDVPSKAIAFDGVWIAALGFIVVDKLSATGDANVIFLTLLFPILTDMGATAFRTLHH